jgi:alginate O-acetyltransferase complex protein AlgF
MNTQTTLRRFTLGACALALGLGMIQAHADDGALYGPKAPKGSAFVRAYNASSAELDVAVGQTQLKQISPLGSSDFKFLPAGSYQAQVGNTQMPVDLEPEHYYTWSARPAPNRAWSRSRPSPVGRKPCCACKT